MTEDEKRKIKARVHRNMKPWQDLYDRQQAGEVLTMADLQAALALMGYERVDDER